MKNKKILKWMEKNLDGLDKMEYFLRTGGLISYDELRMNLDMDHFKGHECLLPILLLSSDSPIVERVHWRLFLEMFRKELKNKGAEKTVEHVITLMEEEHTNWKERMSWMQERTDEN